MVANETRKRIRGMYDNLKPRLSDDLKHLADLPIDKFALAILMVVNKKENPKLLWNEFLAWGYGKYIFYPKSSGKKFLWHLRVFIDWDKSAREDHDMANHMAIAGKKDEEEVLLKDAENHARELLGDNPGALSPEAIEDILGAQPGPA